MRAAWKAGRSVELLSGVEAGRQGGSLPDLSHFLTFFLSFYLPHHLIRRSFAGILILYYDDDGDPAAATSPLDASYKTPQGIPGSPQIARPLPLW